jgi:hypothetical protein
VKAHKMEKLYELKFSFETSRNYLILSSCLHPATIASKTLFITPADAHYNKSLEMLKQFKYPVRTAQ